MQAPPDRPHFRSWPSRVPHGIPPAQTTLWDNLAITAKRYPDRDAYIFLGGRITWSGVRDAAETLAGWLVEAAGVSPGDRVLLCMQNSPQYVIAFYAILRARGVVVPVNPMTRADELPHYIEDPEARVAIVAADLLPEFEKAQAGLPAGSRLSRALVVRYLDHADLGALAPEERPPEAWRPWLEADPVLPDWASPWGDAMRAGHRPPPYAGEPDDLVALCYTSGTTGKPKGAALTHRALLGEMRFSALAPTDFVHVEVVLALPVAHIFGFAMLLGLVTSGMQVYFMPRFRADAVLDAIEGRRCGGFIGVPAMYRMLLEAGAETRDLSCVRFWGSGADAMPAELAETFKRLGASATFPVVGSVGDAVFVEGYGMVEIGGAAAIRVSLPKLPERFGRNLAFRLPGWKFRVVDPVGNELPAGSTGELQLRGPGVLREYWNAPEATAGALTPDGWLRTGDLVRLSRLGTITFCGRSKHVIKSGGYSVYPLEVEAALEEHPSVAEAAVVGKPDPKLGLVPVAAVRVAPGAEVDPDELVAWARERLSSYKAPREVRIVDDLPRTGTSKVQKDRIEELFR